jgi:hypothetical protein
LILEVKVVPAPVKELEFIKLTEPRLTPFTLPLKVLKLEVKAPELIRLVVWLTPLTLLVITLPVEPKILVVPEVKNPVRSKTLLATPLVVLVKLVPESPRELELIIGWRPFETPLTVEVNPLTPLLTRALVVDPVRRGSKLIEVPTTPLTVVERFGPVRVLLTVVPALITD